MGVTGQEGASDTLLTLTTTSYVGGCHGYRPFYTPGGPVLQGQHLRSMGEGKRTAIPEQDRAERQPPESGFIETASGQCWYEIVEWEEDKSGMLYTCRRWESSEWKIWLALGQGNSWEHLFVWPDGTEERVSYYTSQGLLLGFDILVLDSLWYL